MQAVINKDPNVVMKKRKFFKREHIDGWLFVLPFVVSTLAFFIWPLISSTVMSFKEYSFLDQTTVFGAKFVGLKNYTDAFNDPVVQKAFRNTFLYSAVVVPVQLFIALGLALIVDGKIKGKSFFRTAYYLPTVTSSVAVSVMFMFIFKNDGLVNGFLSNFGIKPIVFFNNPDLALPLVMSMAIWSSVGMYMVIFLAGLQDIPQSLYEAASIDGANKRQVFYKVTLPLLKPTVFFNFVISLIGCMQMFDQAFIVSNGTGGPLDSTMTVVLLLYNTGFKQFNMGSASAIAFMLFGVIFVLTLIQKKLLGEETTM